MSAVAGSITSHTTVMPSTGRPGKVVDRRAVVRNHGRVTGRTNSSGAVDAPWLPPGRVVELARRGAMFVRDTGPSDRPPLVLLHGWTVTADLNFFRAYPALAERFRVIAPDLRGHGGGIRPADGIVRLSDCADDAAALLGELEIERATVVGYSMGGLVAQLLWRRHPNRVGGLVLGSTAAHIPTPLGAWVRSPVDPVPWLARRGGRRTDALVRRRTERRVRPDDEHADWMRAEYGRGTGAGVITSLRSLARFDSTPWIGDLDVPAAVIVTGRDTVVPAPQQRDLARRASAQPIAFDGPHDSVVTHHRRYVPLLADTCTTITEAAAESAAQ